MTLASDGIETTRDDGDNRRPRRFDVRPRLVVDSLRYSRFVGAMKVFLPGLAIVLIIAVLAWPSRFEEPASFQLSFATAPGNASDDLTMVNPRYMGTDANGRPFVITANTATQSAEDQRQVTLDNLQADITMDNGAWLTLMAKAGIYHQSQQILSLSGPVNLYSDLGYEFHAEHTRVDLTAGAAETDFPVRGQGPFGALQADRMRITQQGQRLLFEGNVRVTIFPQAEG